jgi:hypothetical protein
MPSSSPGAHHHRSATAAQSALHQQSRSAPPGEPRWRGERTTSDARGQTETRTGAGEEGGREGEVVEESVLLLLWERGEVGKGSAGWTPLRMRWLWAVAYICCRAYGDMPMSGERAARCREEKYDDARRRREEAGGGRK